MPGALTHYAGRIHQLFGDEHHVASPLGAWLLVALCAPLASGTERDELVDALGLDSEVASFRAAELIDNPHQVVGSGVAVWNRPHVETDQLATWRRALPRAARTGDIPTQQSLDDWAEGADTWADPPLSPRGECGRRASLGQRLCHQGVVGGALRSRA